VNRYEMRFVEGGFPATWDGQEQADSRSRLWLRDAPPRPLDFRLAHRAGRRVLPAHLARRAGAGAASAPS
jgi:hypothetical protein